MRIIDVECSRLNGLYLKKNAEEYRKSLGNLIDSRTARRKKAEYLQTAESPGLKAQIMVGTKGTCDLVGCVYSIDCGAFCDFKK